MDIVTLAIALQAKKIAQAVGYGPAGTYATLVALQTANPNHAYIYVVTADGNWYYYNDETLAWTVGGLFIDSSGYNALDTRLTTAEGNITTLNANDTTVGSVAKSIKDAVDPVSTELSTVKVKTVENDLAIADIRRDQTLANQSEAKITTSDYGIVALPKNATGNLKMKKEGLTARNLVVNGDFSNGTTGWNVTYATGSVASQIYTLTGTGSSSSAIMSKWTTIIIDTTTQYFGKIRVRATNSDCTAIVLYLGANGGTDKVVATISNPVLNQWYEINGIAQYASAGGFAGLQIRATYATALLATGKSIEIDGAYGCMLINLTQTFSSIPDLATSKNIFPTYFADTKNVPMTGRYRGSNADETEFHDLYFTAPEGRSVPSAKDSVEVQDGKLVHVKRVGVGALSAEKVGDPTFDNASYWNIRKGSTATITGGECIFNGTDSYVYIEGLTIGNLYKLQVTRKSFTSGVLGVGSTATGSGVLYKESLSEINTIYFIAVSTIVGVGSRSFNTVATIDDFYLKEIATTEGTPKALASQTQVSDDGTNGYYQLATPITTPIDSDGNIPAGASVFWEPAIPDVGIYTTKFDIFDTDHPISSIDKLYKVDFATGVQTQLTDAVVAGDGLSFTSASLTDGDLVNVIYFYATANPEGLTTAEYLNSNVVVADSANGKYYKYKPTITNGAIASWTLTEVV